MVEERIISIPKNTGLYEHIPWLCVAVCVRPVEEQGGAVQLGLQRRPRGCGKEPRQSLGPRAAQGPCVQTCASSPGNASEEWA